ncbi:amylo-alpha-1,6-glucosidase [Arachidicoccus sp.]|uniref:amylo-alpha-1,6-glucosidase n=1 Tax=Arachidicoccus sp. TaxID=1872624 RepID=UPI003D1B502F
MKTLNNDLTRRTLKSQQEHKLQHDKFHIQSDSTHVDNSTHVLNHSNSFAIFDRWGNIYSDGKTPHGIYHRGTRFINHWLLKIDSKKPLLLGSTIKENNNILSIDLTNPVLQEGKIPENTLHIFRHQLIRENGFFEKITCVNYNESDCQFTLAFSFDGDFKDIFEIRGTKRKLRKGPIIYKTDNGQQRVTIIYQGKDNLERKAIIQFDQHSKGQLEQSELRIPVVLQPGKEFSLKLSMLFEIDEMQEQKVDFDEAKKKILHDKAQEDNSEAKISSSNIQLNLWLNRSYIDLFSLQAKIGSYTYPFAGVPWYNTPFGRDGIITAIELLWITPHLARDVLTFLAATQAKYHNPLQDAQPGKILHEAREGEMANTGEVPFKQYYGTVDATPLFIILAGMYYERTADLTFIEQIWPAIEKALDWIDLHGDEDGDGFIEYSQNNPDALTNQGWKDSVDAIMHVDGTLASGSIALCEVQGYVFQAKIYAAVIAKDLGLEELAVKLRTQSESLKLAFNRIFWNENIQSYILALDGEKKPCNVLASNAGHCLFTGIAESEKALKTRNSLMSTEMYSGWGVRTLAKGSIKYNPMSYHNGSIWPHDNAIIAMGFSKYGYKEEVLKIFNGFFEVSTWMELHRIPELFCGMNKRNCEGPTAYPVACSPQAWAVGSVFLLLQACLGLEINALEKTITFHSPVLPQNVAQLFVNQLKVGTKSCTVQCVNMGSYADIQVEGLPEGWQCKIQAGSK